jgi:predicted nucleic acid-binding protein
VIVYFDASALAKRYVEEEHSSEVQRWLDESTPAVCRLSEVEIASALSRRCREGLISLADRDRALATLEADLQAVHVIELTQEVFQAARAALLRHPLRAADAIQLACALVSRDRLQSPIAFLTFDDRLASAPEREGLTSPASD